MFGKLMKYNVMEVGMVMLPIYAAMFVLAAAVGLGQRFSIMKGPEDLVMSTVPGAMLLILMIVYGILNLAMAVVTLVMITRNFRDNLLGSRGYLMDVLPVTTQSQVLSKTLNGVLWTVFGMAASILSGTVALLLFMKKGDWTQLTGAVTDAFGGSWKMAVSLVQIIILLLIWIVQIVTKLYVSISVGNMWRLHRVLGAVLTFVGITVLQAFLANRLTHLTADASLGYSIMGRAVTFVLGIGDGRVGILTARQMAFTAGQNAVYIALFLTGTILVLKKHLDLQ